VVEAAHLPTAPLNSDLARNVVVAAVLGIALAAAGAYLLEFTNTTLASEQEVQRRLGLPVLGALPASDRKNPDQLITAMTHRSESGDAFAALRLNLQVLLRRRAIQTLVLTSAGVDDHRAVVSANLALELARSGQRVILVDADLHRPAQQRLFNLPNQFGLSTALTSSADAPEALLQPASLPGLKVLTSGPLPANPAGLLGSGQMRVLLNQLKAQADIVILDAPPVNAVVDPALLASEADAVALVIAAGRTSTGAVQQAIKTLTRIDAQLLGIIMHTLPVSALTHQPTYGHQVRQKAPPPSMDALLVSRNGHDKPTPIPSTQAGVPAKPRRSLFSRS
jgi:capsular exopolysaccharide synthesis family protein